MVRLPILAHGCQITFACVLLAAPLFTPPGLRARPGSAHNADTAPVNPIAPPDQPYRFRAADWSYIWGASPKDPAAPDGLLYAYTRREIDAWQAAPDPFIIQKETGNRDLWLRMRLPRSEQGWRDAAILFSDFGGLLVMYYKDQRIYARGNMQTREDDYLALHHKLYRLGAIPPAGSDALENPAYLVLHFHANPAVEIEVDLSDGDVWFGERFDLFIQILREDIVRLVIGSLFAITGLVALGAYLRRRAGDTRLYAGFSLFSMCSGVSTFIDTDLVQLLWPQPQIFWDWTGILAIFLLPVGILLFYEQVFGSGWRKIIRRLWQYHLVLSGTTAIAVLLLYQQIDSILAALIAIITVLVLIFWISVGLVLVLLVATTFRSALSGSLQAWLFFFGTLVLAVSAVPDFVTAFSSDTTEADSYFHWGLLIFMVLLIYVADQHFEDMRVKLAEVRASFARTRTELAQAHLKTLQGRMQPHFLFNSLNTIHAMLHVNLAAADRALISLSDSYRFLTDRAEAELIPFREEWEFLQSYLELTRLRFADTIDVRTALHGDLERDYADLRVPPLILQPLVENAVQHGLRGRSGHGQLDIFVRRQGPWLRFECLDNGIGLPDNFTENGFRAGGTLANIRSRLQYHFTRSKLLLANRPLIPGNENAGVRTLLCFRDAKPVPGLAE